MKTKINRLLYFFFCLATIIILSSCSGIANTPAEGKKYQCPMKCEGEKMYDKPGACPVCGMNLVEVENNLQIKSASSVKISGAMMNVMHKGELFGTISLDTIQNKTHLYGLGPVDYLTGEILIDDGHCFVSKVNENKSVSVTENFHVMAPFFVYANVDKWKEVSLPDSVVNISSLERFLDVFTKQDPRPFAFKILAAVDSAEIHIVDLPKGTKVNSPEDAHRNQKTYFLSNENVEMIGFFSTEHAGVFTHHDTFVHIHLINDDKKKMGHLESIKLSRGKSKLFLQQYD